MFSLHMFHYQGTALLLLTWYALLNLWTATEKENSELLQKYYILSVPHIPLMVGTEDDDLAAARRDQRPIPLLGNGNASLYKQEVVLQTAQQEGTSL